MSTTTNELERYQAQWESYWNETRDLHARVSADEARSIWDTPPSAAVELDIPRFKAFFDPSLPIVDFGCGDGTQTPSLARHYKRVIGTDVAPSAIKLASEKSSHDNVRYEVLDAFDDKALAAFHERHGDVNLYMRFVLHQVKLHERAALARAIDTLLGRRGALYLYEMSTAARAYIETWLHEHGMPSALQRILKTGAAPGPVDATLVRQTFSEDEYTYLSEGVAVASRTIDDSLLSSTAGGSGRKIPFEPPTYFAVLRRK